MFLSTTERSRNVNDFIYAMKADPGFRAMVRHADNQKRRKIVNAEGFDFTADDFSREKAIYFGKAIGEQMYLDPRCIICM